MSIFVDGVEIVEVFVDGVVQDSVFSDGVQVYSGVPPANDYFDDFTGDPSGTYLLDHQMNTGQSWAVISANPLQNPIGNLLPELYVMPLSAAPNVGAWVGYHQNGQAGTMIQQIQPVLDPINPSFICDINFALDATRLIWVTQSNFSVQIFNNVKCSIDVLAGITAWGIVVNDVSIEANFFTNDSPDGCRIRVYCDGVDIACEFWITPSGERAVALRQPINSSYFNDGRIFTCQAAYTGTGGTDTNVCGIYNVDEFLVVPAAMPWPS